MTTNIGRSARLLMAAALLSTPMLSACGGDKEAEAAAGAVATKQLRLAGAFDECKQMDKGTLSLEDDGTTIIIDTGSEYGDPAGYVCVLMALDVPSSITAQMDRTSALMGVQDASHNGYDFSWSYHPDNGVNMVITDTGATTG